jgi:hypothetical protein
VYQQGFHLLSKHPRRLSLDALWALREEVAIAALHVGEVERAGQLIELIVKQFGGSVRAYRLMVSYPFYNIIRTFFFHGFEEH